MKKLSIYCYHHSPHKGVGGRRWKEFGKSLAERGFDVTVTVAPWVGDIPPSSSGVNIRFLQRTIWRRFPFKENRAFLKPIWLAQKLIWKIRRGGYVDQTDGLKTSIKKAVQEDLLNQVDCILVSCAPFHWALHVASELNSSESPKRPKFIVDLRDPWSSNRIAYLVGASDRVRKNELNRELYCMESADLILSVDRRVVTEDYQNSSKLHIVPNGAKMPVLTNTKSHSIGEVVNLVFVGTMYKDCFEEFLSFLVVFEDVLRGIGRKLEVVIAGRWFPDFVESISELQYCSFLGELSASEVTVVWQKADIGISVISDSMRYAVNTKMIECVARKKPLLLVGKTGKAAEFLVKNKLGFFWDVEQESKEERIIDWIISGAPIGPAADLSGFDLDSLVERVVDLVDG